MTTAKLHLSFAIVCEVVALIVHFNPTRELQAKMCGHPLWKSSIKDVRTFLPVFNSLPPAAHICPLCALQSTPPFRADTELEDK